MKIDKSKIKMGMWYEDHDGNMIKFDDTMVDGVPENVETCHTLFPLEVRERIDEIVDISKCKHKRCYRKKDTGLVDGMHGIICERCHSYKLAKWYVPLWLKKWIFPYSSRDTKGSMKTHTHLITCCTALNDEKLILAMANSGDYTLKESIAILAQCCERCHNVLAYKYLKGEDGYPEYSDEWKKCNTRCDFCKDTEGK